jgi:hypothetical protein
MSPRVVLPTVPAAFAPASPTPRPPLGNDRVPSSFWRPKREPRAALRKLVFAKRAKSPSRIWAVCLVAFFCLAMRAISALPEALTRESDPIAKVEALRQYIEGAFANELSDAIHFPTTERRASVEANARELGQIFGDLNLNTKLPLSVRAALKVWEAYVRIRMGWLLYQDIKNKVALPGSAVSMRCQELTREGLAAVETGFDLLRQAEQNKSEPEQKKWFDWLRGWPLPAEQRLYESQVQALDLLWLLTREKQYQQRVREIWAQKITADYKLRSGAMEPEAAKFSVPQPAGVPPWMIAAAGLVIVFVVLTLLIKFPNMPPDARSVARLIAAVGVAYCGAVFTGSIEVTWGKIAAGTGTFALFILCFVWNPASGARR